LAKETRLFIDDTGKQTEGRALKPANSGEETSGITQPVGSSSQFNLQNISIQK
jgi:hypothetical protein